MEPNRNLCGTTFVVLAVRRGTFVYVLHSIHEVLVRNGVKDVRVLPYLASPSLYIEADTLHLDFNPPTLGCAVCTGETITICPNYCTCSGLKPLPDICWIRCHVRLEVLSLLSLEIP